jgi:outer membrane lipoprotein-sorting protein
MKSHFILFAFILCLLSLPSLAANSISYNKDSVIRKVETYFQSLTTAEASFLQTANDGTQHTGKFYLSRPGRLRFQYDAPLTDFIVADGAFIYFYDGQLKQQSNAPISQTLADFILRNHLKLSGDLRVTKIAKGAGLLQVTIVQTSDPASGSLTLGFTETPKFELKKWHIRDASGAVTEIELSKLKRGVKFKSGLFNYFDPKPRELN